ncbi:recombinase family protein, partial [Paenibacillus sp. MCAF20]
DEEFEESRNEIREEQEKLNQMLSNYQEQVTENKPPLDLEQVKRNFDSALRVYKNASDTEDKNTILKSIFDKVYVEVSEKGRGSIPSKFILYPVLKHDFLYVDFLVL